MCFLSDAACIDTNDGCTERAGRRVPRDLDLPRAWYVDRTVLGKLPPNKQAVPAAAGVMVCSLEQTRDFDQVVVQVGSDCPVRRGFRSNARSEWFALPNVALSAGEGVAVYLKDRTLIGAHKPGFVRARFVSDWPIHAEQGGTSLTCFLAKPEAVEALAGEKLRTAHGLLAIRRQVPDSKEDDDLKLARAEVYEAGWLLGFDHPQILSAVADLR